MNECSCWLMIRRKGRGEKCEEEEERVDVRMNERERDVKRMRV